MKESKLPWLKGIKECTLEVDCSSCDARCCRGGTDLLEEDVKQISKHGFKRRDFLSKPRGHWETKTKKGICIFLDSETRKCKIHEFEPIFCKLGPITIALDKPYGYDLDWKICPKAKEIALSQAKKIMQLGPLIVKFRFLHHFESEKHKG